MSIEPVSILGGKSVYCINESQLSQAEKLAYEDLESSPRIQKALHEVEESLSRNELAALAFVLIQRLKKEQS